MLNSVFASQPNMGHSFRPVPEDPNRWRQSSRIICEVLTKWQVYPGSHIGQHTETVGLQQGQVPQDLHWTPQWEILHLCKFLSDRREGECRLKPVLLIPVLDWIWHIVCLFDAVDCVGFRRQLCIHLEPANKRGGPEATRTHRWGSASIWGESKQQVHCIVTYGTCMEVEHKKRTSLFLPPKGPTQPPVPWVLGSHSLGGKAVGECSAHEVPSLKFGSDTDYPDEILHGFY